jgi:hypothetical protein
MREDGAQAEGSFSSNGTTSGASSEQLFNACPATRSTPAASAVSMRAADKLDRELDGLCSRAQARAAASLRAHFHRHVATMPTANRNVSIRRPP